MPVTEVLVTRNATYSAEVLARGGLAAKGTQKVAVVACMDSRVDVFAALGLARRGARHPQRRRSGHRGHDPLPDDQPAADGH